MFLCRQACETKQATKWIALFPKYNGMKGIGQILSLQKEEIRKKEIMGPQQIQHLAGLD